MRRAFNKISAPFTEEQQDKIYKWQSTVSPGALMCPECFSILVVREDGLYCIMDGVCNYRVRWVPDFVLDAEL